MTPHIPHHPTSPELFPFHSAPLHPHHSVLQIALELGVIGLALCTAALVLLVRHIGKVQDITARHAAFTFLTTYLLAGLFSFGIWQNWWVACGLLTAILWQHFSQPR